MTKTKSNRHDKKHAHFKGEIQKEIKDRFETEDATKRIINEYFNLHSMLVGCTATGCRAVRDSQEYIDTNASWLKDYDKAPDDYRVVVVSCWLGE